MPPEQTEIQRNAALNAANLSQEQQTSVIAGTPATSVAPIPVQDPQEPVEPLDIQLQPEVDPSIQSIFEETVFAPSDIETQGEDIFTKQLESIAKGSQLITEEAGLREQLEEAEFTKQLNEVTGQIEGLRLESLDLANKRKIIPSQIDAQFGIGATKAGIAPLVAGALRENTFRQVSVASQALVLQASAFVLQGQYDRAESKINRAIDLKYSLLENEQKFYTALLDRNKELLSREDKQRVEVLQLRLIERDEQIADQKLEEKRVFDIGRDLQQVMQDSGVSDPALIRRVQNAGSPEEALAIAGEFVPKLSEKERLQNELLRKKIDEEDVKNDKGLFTTDDGTEYDLSTIEGIQGVIDFGKTTGDNYGYAELFAFMDKNITSLTSGAIKNLLIAAGLTPTEKVDEKFLNEDFFRELFTEDQLKEAAKEGGFTEGGFLGLGVGKKGVQNFIDDLMKKIEAFRGSGLSDEEILKRMQ